MFTPVADDDLVHRPEEVVRIAGTYAADDGVRALVFDHDQYCLTDDGQVSRSEPTTRFDYTELPRFIGITYKLSAGMGELAEKYESTNHATRACSTALVPATDRLGSRDVVLVLLRARADVELDVVAPGPHRDHQAFRRAADG